MPENLSHIPLHGVQDFLVENSASRRQFMHVLRFWEIQREDRPFPTEEDLIPSGLGYLWHHCYLIQRRDILEPEKGNYQYIGREIVKPYEEDVLEKDNGHVVNPTDMSLGGKYQQVLDKKEPLIDEDVYEDSRGDVVKYRQCLLPLGTPEEVTAVFGAMFFMVERKDAA